MARPKGTKNIMRSPEEKVEILNEYLIKHISLEQISKEKNIDLSLLKRWKKKYLEKGIEGLISKSGKTENQYKGIWSKKNKTIEDDLKLKIMKLEIENARLKKGYIVRGGGDQKEYVTTFEENMKYR